MTTPFEQLDLLRNTKSNWDSYGADAPRPECIDAAARFLRLNQDVRLLPPPYVMPTRIGGVMFAWQDGPYQLEIEVESPKRGGFVYLNIETDEATEGDFDLDHATTRTPTSLKAILAEFAGLVAA